MRVQLELSLEEKLTLDEWRERYGELAPDVIAGFLEFVDQEWTAGRWPWVPEWVKG